MEIVRKKSQKKYQNVLICEYPLLDKHYINLLYKGTDSMALLYISFQCSTHFNFHFIRHLFDKLLYQTRKYSLIEIYLLKNLANFVRHF